MNYKKQIKLILSVSLVIIIGIFIYFSLNFFNVCSSKNSVCLYELDARGQPFLLILGVVFISTLPLLFLKEKVYKAWRVFALWAVPLSLLWIFLTPIHGSGGVLATGREYITFLVSGLFLAISYILIIYKTWGRRS